MPDFVKGLRDIKKCGGAGIKIVNFAPLKISESKV
jgi:hypothetical protein